MNETKINKSEIKLEILQDRGVDNWSYYGDAISDYENEFGPIVDSEDLLNALEYGGVDNWDGYATPYLDEYLEADTDLSYDEYEEQREQEYKMKLEQERLEKERIKKENANKENENKPKGGIVPEEYSHRVLREHLKKHYPNAVEELFDELLIKNKKAILERPIEIDEKSFRSALNKSLNETSASRFKSVSLNHFVDKIIKNGKLNKFIEKNYAEIINDSSAKHLNDPLYVHLEKNYGADAEKLYTALVRSQYCVVIEHQADIDKEAYEAAYEKANEPTTHPRNVVAERTELFINEVIANGSLDKYVKEHYDKLIAYKLPPKKHTAHDVKQLEKANLLVIKLKQTTDDTATFEYTHKENPAIKGSVIVKVPVIINALYEDIAKDMKGVNPTNLSLQIDAEELRHKAEKAKQRYDLLRKGFNELNEALKRNESVTLTLDEMSAIVNELDGTLNDGPTVAEARKAEREYKEFITLHNLTK